MIRDHNDRRPRCALSNARLAAVAVSFCLAAGCAVDEVEHASTTRGVGMFEEVRDFGANPGGLKMFRYAPANAQANAPLMVAFHACSQDAREFQKAGWNELADQHGFYVMYPEQQTNNNALRCFNWAGEYGDPTNLRRGEGENQSLKNMVDKMLADYSVDPSRVFAMGHSGGAAQVSLMMAVWPDVFAGGAIIAGIPYHCTTVFREVSSCLNPGMDKTPMQWGDFVRDAHTHGGDYPKISIWHGTADGTVSTTNANELLEQWTNVHGIDMTPDGMSQVDGAPRVEYKDAGGVTRVETFLINGMGHGTPVVPGMGCGQTGTFFLNQGICAARVIAESFGMIGGGPGPMRDTTAPTVNVTAPATGATVRGPTMITVDASDDTGVAEVEIYANTTRLHVANAPPYSHLWTPVGLADGQYTIRAVAKDAAGNSAADEDTTITLSTGVTDTTDPTVNVTAPTDGATVSGMVTITVDAADDYGLSMVEVLVDGAVIGAVTAAPFEVQWDASQLAAGTYAISARAVDAAGNDATDDDTTVTVEMSAEDMVAPTVMITSHADGAALSGVVTVAVDATDTSPIGVVFLFLEGDLIGSDYRPPYEFLWDTDTFPEGTYTVTARAQDVAGNIGAHELTGVTITHSTGAMPPAGGGEGGEGRRVLLGKRRWGCSATPTTDAGVQWGLLLLAGLMIRRRRR